MRKFFASVLALCLLVTAATASGLLINPYRYGGGAPPASVTIADTNTFADDTGTSASYPVNLPPNIASGDLLLVFFARNANATITDPSGWAVLVSKLNGDTFRLYAKIADGSEGSTVTVGATNNGRVSAASYRITGARNGVTSSEIAVSSAVDGASATPDPPSLTPSWGSAENLWIAVTFAASSNFTFSSYPTNYTLGQINAQTGSNGNSNAVTLASRLLTATSEDPGVFTTVSSQTRSTYTLAIRPQ